MAKKKVEEKKKSKVLQKSKDAAKQLKKEMNNSINVAIVSAFGFLIALIWRDVITEFVNKISMASPVQGKLFSALLVTLICVLGIVLVTRIFKKQE